MVGVDRLDVTFHAINELDLHTECSATFAPDPDGAGMIATVAVVQDGRTLGDVSAVLRPR